MRTKFCVRNLGYAGPGEVGGELCNCSQHLLRCDGRADDMEIHKEGENCEQEVASHH